MVNGIFFGDNANAGNGSSALYVLQSFGSDLHGAYPRAGGTVRLSAGSVNTAELENCDCDSTGVSTAFNTIFAAYPPSKNSSNIYDNFDDIVHFKQRRDLPGWNE